MMGRRSHEAYSRNCLLPAGLHQGAILKAAHPSAGCSEVNATVSIDRDMVPHQSALPIDTPPPSDTPTTAMLKADINSGATGDKTEVFDPGMAMLGTCEEAGGHALSPKDIAIARHHEGAQRWTKGARKRGYAHHHSNAALYGYISFIGVVAMVFVGALAVT